MKKGLRWGILTVVVVGIIMAANTYFKFTSRNLVPKEIGEKHINIPSGSEFEEVAALLKEEGIVPELAVFKTLSSRMNYQRSPMRSGRFKIEGGWSMTELIRHLRNGKQAPVKLVLNNERLIENVAAKAARFIEPDSLTIWELMKDENYLQEIGYTNETLMSLFIPNTYEFFWNSTAKGFLKRMQKEHKIFWKKEREIRKSRSTWIEPRRSIHPGFHH